MRSFSGLCWEQTCSDERKRVFIFVTVTVTVFSPGRGLSRPPQKKDSASVGVFPGKVVFCNTAAKMDDLQILVEWERAQLCDYSSAVHGDVR